MKITKNTQIVVENGRKRTTLGFTYAVHEEGEKRWILDDFGDKLYIDEESFVSALTFFD